MIQIMIVLVVPRPAELPFPQYINFRCYHLKQTEIASAEAVAMNVQSLSFFLFNCVNTICVMRFGSNENLYDIKQDVSCYFNFWESN